MEELKALCLKEEFLLIKIKAIQEKIALYDESLDATVNSEQDFERKKSESIPLKRRRVKKNQVR